MADAVTILFIILHIIWWPISKFINLTILLLSPFYRVGSFLLLPFIHLGRTITNVISLPFTVQWRERFETLYIFLGTAALIGCLAGAIVFITFKFLSSSLRVDSSIMPESREHGPTAAEYRAARRVKKEEEDPSLPTTPVVLKKVNGPRRRGLLSQAIIEEEDSDF